MAVLSSKTYTLAQEILPIDLYQSIEQDGSEQAYIRATDWLQERLDIIQQYIPKTVVQHYVSQESDTIALGEFREATLLFADLSGFTSLSEHLAALGREGAEEITRIINRLFAALTAEVNRFGGDLIRFSGDALTAIFDATTLGVNHPDYALGAATAMQNRMEEVGNVETRLGEFQLNIRIGVHSGEVFLATVGDHVHRELIVVGPTVNQVAAAQEAAKPGATVVSSATYKAIQLAKPTVDNLDAQYLSIVAADIPQPPQMTPVQLVADTNDPEELTRLLTLYKALSLYLPVGLTEHQLYETAELAKSGLRLVAALFAQVTQFSTIIEYYQDQPHQIRPILNQYYTTIQQIIMHYGGVVNKLDLAADGDKILAIFGAPVAHENDAELALRAGLSMQEAINYINAEIQLADSSLPLLDQRIGINQGHVFAGLVGSQDRREYTIMGDSVNTTARLMSSADYGDVLVGPLIRQNCHSGFEFEVLKPIVLKGKSEPITPARVTRMYHVRRDFERAPLVGRAKELATIQALAETALNGKGQTVFVSGEAGIGKTRLAEESLQWITIQSFDSSSNTPVFIPVTLECQFYEQRTPYASITILLRQILRITETTTLEKTLARIERLVPHLSHLAPILAELLNLEIAETSLTQSLSPEQRHDRVIDLVEAILRASTHENPTIIIWDDIHWLDASSQEILTRITTSMHDIPLFIIALSRDIQNVEAFEPQHHLHLNELNNDDRIALVKAMLNSEVPEPLIQRWNTPNDQFFNPQGNPFFIEEMIRALVDHHILVRVDDRWQLHGNLDSLPSTIEGMLTARLDQLDVPYRETIQVAAVVGRRFQIKVLENLLKHSELPEHLNYITAADLVQPDQMASDLAYLFKHTMIRDVAYETILYARRRELHRRVAQEIEELYADRLEEMYGILANHYLQAENWQKAFDYVMLAGKRAQHGYANQEAIEHYKTAVSLLANLNNVLSTQIIDLYEQLGNVHTLVGNYDLAFQALEKAENIAKTHQLHEHIGRIMRLTAVIYERKAEYESALEIIMQIIRIYSEYIKHSSLFIHLHILTAGIYQRQGDHKLAIEWGEKALQFINIYHHYDLQAEVYLSIGGSYRLLGDINKATDYLHKSLEMYIDLNNISRIADSYMNLANTYTDSGKYDIAIDFFNKSLEIKKSMNDQYACGILLINIGDLYSKQGMYEESISVLKESLIIWDKLKSDFALAVCYMNLGSAYLLDKNYELSIHYLGLSETTFIGVGVEAYMPELYRLFASAHIEIPSSDQTFYYLQQSLKYCDKLDTLLDKGLSLLLLGRYYINHNSKDLALENLILAKEILTDQGNIADIERCNMLIRQIE